ncbi:4'-phosphopantetheinyl transferase family protein [Streptomyces minutiscleroticus]|uniref:4'-phosphopantetheinyl transferase n=1 Tax=Streptomyces minutiscleroticus TaxID=68238 RepID=A0A918NFF0_9ACTN|nr:4'-phosphopantetheinyl transferase superfamily protein [Streptomyces minutiscleroticus]GGX66549.1 4'-phosphopantetheinyl transferase [Streptomyces minutiscleroticus]
MRTPHDLRPAGPATGGGTGPGPAAPARPGHTAIGDTACRACPEHVAADGRPSSGDRRLWLLPESAAEAFVARLGGTVLLDDDERARCERALAPHVRLRRVAGRLLARHALSAFSGRPAGSWRFRTTADGRPEPVLPAGSGLRFNVSHTDGLIVCVVTDRGRACGVDAETCPAGADAVTYLPRLLAGRERADLAAVADGPARAARVAEYWVLKEAYLKALGTGLRREPSSFAFTRPSAPPVRLHDPERPAEHWHFDLIRPTPHHVVAVATEHAGPAGLRTTVLSG